MERERAIALLPEAHSAALRMRDLGLDEGTIADRLGIPRQAAGPLLVIAEAKLADLLAADDPDTDAGAGEDQPVVAIPPQRLAAEVTGQVEESG